MNRFRFRVVTLASFVALSLGANGCPPVNTVVNDALTVAQFVCIQSSNSTAPSEVALACSIISEAAKLAPELEAFIAQLIASREQSKAAGLVYDKKVGWKRPTP